MVAFGKNVTNPNIFSEVYIQQKAHWDPDGILDDLTFENIHSDNFKEKKEWNLSAKYNIGKKPEETKASAE